MRRALLLPLALLAAAAAVDVDAEPVPRTEVPKERIRVDDGDGMVIRWPGEPYETVRVLGIDTPETQHLDHDIPFAQSSGEEARGFFQGAVAVASKVEIVRAAEKDPYGRTLAYVFLDGKNYSVLVVAARLALENVSHFGDNGFPAEAKAVQDAAKAAGPVPFERPHVFRARMRELARWMKENGTYPVTPAPAGAGR